MNAHGGMNTHEQIREMQQRGIPLCSKCRGFGQIATPGGDDAWHINYVICPICGGTGSAAIAATEA